MNFDKSKVIGSGYNKNIYTNKIDTDETIIFDEEYIFLENIKTTKDIVVTKKTIVLGDLECNFLNALEEIICYGNISANIIYTNRDIEYFRDIKYNNILGGNLIGNRLEKQIIKEVEVVKEVIKEIPIEKIVEINSFEDIKIDSENLSDKLFIIDEFKEKVNDYIESELIFLDDDILIEDLEQIGLTFIEYKEYADKLKRIIEYSKKDYINSLYEYIEFLDLIKELPECLEGIDIVEKTINKHKIYNLEDILELQINISNQDDFTYLISKIEKNRDILENVYDKLIYNIVEEYYSIIKNSDKVSNKKESIVDIFKEVIEDEIKIKKDLNEIYDNYLWKKGSIIECKVESNEDKYLNLINLEDENNESIKVKMINLSPDKYKIGDTVYGYIKQVNLNENYVEIIISNESENTPRLLFNKLKEKYGLNKCKVQTYRRLKNISVCIVVILYGEVDYKEKIKKISEVMKKHLDYKHIGIFVYDPKPENFAANILDIDAKNITIDEISKKCIVYVNNEQESRIKLLLKTQITNIESVFEYTIELKIKQDKNNNTKDDNIKYKYNNDYVYRQLLSKKGSLLSGIIKGINKDGIEIDIGYNSNAVIKHFDKRVFDEYKIGDYIDAIIENIVKKDDNTVKAVLSRDDVDFTKAVLKHIKNELLLKNIILKKAKKLSNQEGYAVLISYNDKKPTKEDLERLKSKIEAKLRWVNVDIYVYNEDIKEFITGIVGAYIKEVNTDANTGICNIVCLENQDIIIKEKLEIIKSFIGCKTVNIISKSESDNKNKTEILDNRNRDYDVYLRLLFDKIKNDLGIKYCTIKKCSYDKEYGAFLIVSNRYNSATKDEIKYIEALMNKEFNDNNIKIVEFNYEIEPFLCDAFDITKSNIEKSNGIYYIRCLNRNKFGQFNFIKNEISKIVNYKIAIL